MATDFQARAIVPEKAQRPVINNTGADFATAVFLQLVGAADTLNDPPQVQLPGAGETAYGVLTTSRVRAGVTPDVGLVIGEIGDVQIEGRVQVRAGATVALGASVASMVTGLAITAGSGDFVLGKALEEATIGELLEVELSGPSQGAPLA